MSLCVPTALGSLDSSENRPRKRQRSAKRRRCHGKCSTSSYVHSRSAGLIWNKQCPAALPRVTDTAQHQKLVPMATCIFPLHLNSEDLVRREREPASQWSLACWSIRVSLASAVGPYILFPESCEAQSYCLPPSPTPALNPSLNPPSPDLKHDQGVT